MITRPTTLGVIVGNRGFFPSHLCSTGRTDALAALEREGLRAVALSADATPYGSVETLTDARACADLFRSHRDEIDGVLVTLPNFGDERAVANTLRWAGLDVPVLVHAFADDCVRMTIEQRRDSFCGKMSVCNNLRQYGIPYSLTTLHTVAPSNPSFGEDLRRFAATCRVARSLKHARIGAIGARPAAFNTVRYSEKLFERSGISVETLDLSELLGWIQRMPDSEPAVKAKLAAIGAYTGVQGIPTLSLMKMAKLGVAIDRWMAEKALSATAIQCWTSLEEFFGVVPCTIMSMMSDNLLSSACETDVCGTLSMHMLQLASGTPSALLDWNNNYGTDPNKAVCFHCSNLPKHFFREVRMDFQEIIAGTVGKENTFGTAVGKVKSGAMSYARFSTVDTDGVIRGYVGEGKFTDDSLETFGGAGVVEIPELQKLLHYICSNGFEHHVAANFSSVAAAVQEAAQNYLGWETYYHAA